MSDQRPETQDQTLEPQVESGGTQSCSCRLPLVHCTEKHYLVCIRTTATQVLSLYARARHTSSFADASIPTRHTPPKLSGDEVVQDKSVGDAVNSEQ